MKTVQRKRRRVLTPAQKVLIAKDLYRGANIKAIAQDWHVSENQVYKIFTMYLAYQIVWKKSCKNFEMCIYPLCKCGCDLG